MFAIAFAVIKKFLNDYTLSKIQIFKADPKKWKAVLLENIDADSLPKHFGGNLADPDGNPKYTIKVMTNIGDCPFANFVASVIFR